MRIVPAEAAVKMPCLTGFATTDSQATSAAEGEAV